MNSSPSSRRPQIFWDGGNLVVHAHVEDGFVNLKASPQTPENEALVERYRAEILKQLGIPLAR